MVPSLQKGTPVYRVFDSFLVLDPLLKSSVQSWYDKYGRVLALALDPKQISEAPDLVGKEVMVRTPEGSVCRPTIVGIEVLHGMVFLMTWARHKRQIPRNSTVEW